MLRSLFHDKRGISEVVASLMMILIVSIAGTALYAYSVNSLGSSGSSFQLETAQKKEKARERLLITIVWWNVSNNYMNITVLNYGKIEFAIDTLYVDGTQVPASAFTEGKGVTVEKGAMIPIKFTSPVPITGGQTYEITAVTERGSRDVVYWEA